MKKNRTLVAFIALALCINSFTVKSQTANPKIKCYFNHPVNTNVSSGVNAIYLNTTFKDTLIAYINRAKYTIDFCVYNFYQTSASDNINAIATAVNNAYARGVAIRWVCNGTSTNSALVNLNSNIHSIASPTTTGYGICHNKFVVFDANSANANEAIVWTGSFNFTTEQNSTDYNNVLIIQDKPLAQAYYSQFNQMWGGTALTPNTTNSKFGIYKTASAVNSFTVNGTPIQVYFSPKDGAGTQLQNVINSANTELAFGIYTFTDHNAATAIKTKIAAGVAAFGIMDTYSQTYCGSSCSNSPYTVLSPPAVMGTNLKVYNGGGAALYHNKIILADALHPASDPQVGAGSFNWTLSAESTNDENFIIIHDAIIANQYYQSLCKNFVDVGGTACASVTTGIDAFDYGLQQYAIYPSPFKDNFTIKVKDNGDVLKVKIINMIGQTVKEAEVVYTDEINISLQNQPAGIYYVQITRGVKVYVQKLVKE